MDGRLLWLRSDDPLEQLLEVADAFGIGAGAMFTRCTRCDTPLEPARESDLARAPPAVRAAGLPLSRCPGCGRVYWEGSHTRRMRETAARVLGAGGGG